MFLSILGVFVVGCYYLGKAYAKRVTAHMPSCLYGYMGKRKGACLVEHAPYMRSVLFGVIRV